MKSSVASELLYATTRGLGLQRLARYVTRRRIILLTIHGVLDESTRCAWTPLWPRLSLRKFERLVALLSRDYRFASLSEAIAALTGAAALRDPTIVFTFDDGYRNNLTRALPVLRHFGAVPVFFVATGRVSSQTPFAVDRLDFVLQRLAAQRAEINIDGEAQRLAPDDRAGQHAVFSRLVAGVRRGGAAVNDSAFEPLLAELESRAGTALRDPADEASGVLSWNELRPIADDGLAEIGSHTVDHTLLGTVDRATALDELVRSKRCIEDRLARPCLHFCYPAGNHSAQTPGLVRQAGYACGITNECGRNQPGCDPFVLRRIGVPPGVPLSQIVTRISGLADLMRRR